MLGKEVPVGMGIAATPALSDTCLDVKAFEDALVQIGRCRPPELRNKSYVSSNSCMSMKLMLHSMFSSFVSSRLVWCRTILCVGSWFHWLFRSTRNGESVQQDCLYMRLPLNLLLTLTRFSLSYSVSTVTVLEEYMERTRIGFE
jgi:hypothetical protein